MKNDEILKRFREDLVKCSRKSSLCFLWLKTKYLFLSVFLRDNTSRKILLRKIRRMKLFYKWRDSVYKEKIKELLSSIKVHIKAIIKSIKGGK